MPTYPFLLDITMGRIYLLIVSTYWHQFINLYANLINRQPIWFYRIFAFFSNYYLSMFFIYEVNMSDKFKATLVLRLSNWKKHQSF